MIEKALSEVRGEILQGDLLLFRGKGLVSWLISKAGRTNYTHAAKADWWDDELYCCEVRELKGGRIVTLQSQVKQYPGLIDVYRTNPSNNPSYDRQAAARYMRNFAGCNYGYWSVIGTAFLHMFLVRLLTRTDYTTEIDSGEAPSKPPYCSQAISMADRIAGRVDPVLNLADRLTEPGDLARSPFYEAMFTLSTP